jgi:capsular polysaccharide transport system ATP-binding protein
VGDAAFRQRSDALFKERMKHSGAVVVSHTMEQIRKLCDAVVVLENGKLQFYDDVDAGIRAHNANMENG